MNNAGDYTSSIDNESVADTAPADTAPMEYRTGASDGYITSVEQIVLDPKDGNSGELFRKILRAEFVKNGRAGDEHKTVRFDIGIQRRHRGGGEWQEPEFFNPATLKGGEEVRLRLSCTEAYDLHQHLQRLFGMSQGDLPAGNRQFVVADVEEAVLVVGPARETLHALLERDGDNVWGALEELRPGLLETVALRRQHQARVDAVAEFRAHLDDPEWRESKWQSFFAMNSWIFGHGLDNYRFLTTLRREATYGSADIDGTGAPRGDFLTATEGNVGFTVLVEIKRPNTLLLGTHAYRNRAWQLGEELAGGVAQVQAQCAQWSDGSQTRGNRDLERAGIFTYEPEGILVIGNTAQFADDEDKRSTFERFRRNLQNPRVVTFDELLARAEFMVQCPYPLPCV